MKIESMLPVSRFSSGLSDNSSGRRLHFAKLMIVHFQPIVRK